MQFGLADYKLNKVSGEHGTAFTLEEYIESSKLSGQVRLYLMSEAAEEPQHGGTIDSGSSDGDSLPAVLTNNKASQPTESVEGRRRLIRDQDQAYQESLASDKKKDEARHTDLASELLNTERQESNRHSRELRVQCEPVVEKEHCTVCETHTLDCWHADLSAVTPRLLFTTG